MVTMNFLIERSGVDLKTTGKQLLYPLFKNSNYSGVEGTGEGLYYITLISLFMPDD